MAEVIRHAIVQFDGSEHVWLASVAEIPECHTYGRSLDQVRRRLREALSLWIDDAVAVELKETIELPGPVTEALDRTRTARSDAERAAALAAQQTRTSARLLTRDLGLSTRDAATLLDLSHQRVAQLLGEAASRSAD